MSAKRLAAVDRGASSWMGDHFAALLPIVELVLGPEPPATPAIRHNLASFAGEAGDAAGPATSSRAAASTGARAGL